MNMSWLSMIGGGITAAATLAVGISTSGIMAADTVSNDLAPASAETIYVEQPVIEVSASTLPFTTVSVDPIVIAILPAPIGAPSVSDPAVTDPSVPSDPSMSIPSYEDGDEYVEDEDDAYEEDEDEYEEDEDEEDEDEYEGPEEGDDD
jgi:hypothetical protein